MKIVAITTIRSDYDLMSRLYRSLNDDPEIEFKLLLAGAHMSSTYGMTVEQVEADGFEFLLKSETLLDSDSPLGRLKSASLMLLSFVDTVANYKPDLIIYAGDREDVIIGALLGGYLSIPTMHFFSGDHAADGHIDNPVRHATSKLSTFHCVSVEQHADRLKALGEPEERIGVIGSIALDKFVAHQSMTVANIFSQLKLPVTDKNIALVIFHPIKDERDFADQILKSIINSLLAKGFFVFVGAPNSDPDNRQLMDVYNDYNENSDVYFYKSLSRDIFLSIFKRSKLIVGNSSAGVLEAASIPIPAVNVGARQVGRLVGENVIFCDSNMESISSAIDEALTPEFLAKVSSMQNLYGDGRSVEKAIEIIKNTDFAGMLYKKEDPLLVSQGYLK